MRILLPAFLLAFLLHGCGQSAHNAAQEKSEPGEKYDPFGRPVIGADSLLYGLDIFRGSGEAISGCDSVFIILDGKMLMRLGCKTAGDETQWIRCGSGSHKIETIILEGNRHHYASLELPLSKKGKTIELVYFRPSSVKELTEQLAYAKVSEPLVMDSFNINMDNKISACRDELLKDYSDSARTFPKVAVLLLYSECAYAL